MQLLFNMRIDTYINFIILFYLIILFMKDQILLFKRKKSF